MERSGERERREGGGGGEKEGREGGGRKRRKGQRRRRPRLDVHTNAESLLCEVSGPFCKREADAEPRNLHGRQYHCSSRCDGVSRRHCRR